MKTKKSQPTNLKFIELILNADKKQVSEKVKSFKENLQNEVKMGAGSLVK